MACCVLNARATLLGAEAKVPPLWEEPRRRGGAGGLRRSALFPVKGDFDSPYLSVQVPIQLSLNIRNMEFLLTLMGSFPEI